MTTLLPFGYVCAQDNAFGMHSGYLQAMQLSISGSHIRKERKGDSPPGTALLCLINFIAHILTRM
jgi:hypothetical protein